MGPILIQGISFLFVIVISYLLKKMGVFNKKDGHIVSRLILNLTLPATIILGFNSIEVNSVLFIMILLGILSNILLISIGGILWRDKNPQEQALMMFGQAGYNIGNFVIPFVQGFFPEAIPFIGSFDTGNALMVFGGNPVLIDKFIGEKEAELDIKYTIKKLFSSPSFTTYVVMILLAMMNLSVPTKIIPIIELFASANSFLAMVIIGLYLEINISTKDLRKVSFVLFIRYALSGLLALLFYFILPFPKVIRLSLVILALAPMGTVSTINMVEYGNKESVTGFVSSSTIIISLLLITIALYFLI